MQKWLYFIIHIQQIYMQHTSREKLDKYSAHNLNFYVWVTERGLLFQSNNLIDTHVFVIHKSAKYT